MRFVFIAVIVLSALVPTTAPATAAEGDFYQMVFPVDGDHHYTDTWGAPRGGGRTHEGTDIMADKMVPVVAVASGTIGWTHDTLGGNCCAMELNHDDGWSSWYIHLNNDTPGTDDGQGWGFAPGIERGVHVEAGQLIGYVGDSGNAEASSPHVHFELHMPDGTKVNPYPHLTSAVSRSVAEELSIDSPCPAGATCDSVALVDVGARFHLMGELRWQADQLAFYYGNPTDYALMGDWDCDGIATPAMYRSSNGFMYLRNSNTQGVADLDFFYGDPSDVPLAGDFNGDGCDTLGIYRPDEGKIYIKNSLGTGIADESFYFGNPGDKPFVGDFDGDGIDTVGLHREDTGFVYFRNTNTSGIADFEFFYGDPGDTILAGDWDGDGDDTVAVFRPSTGTVYLKFDNSAGPADQEVLVGTGWATALVAPSHHAGSGMPAEEEAVPPEEPPAEDPDEGSTSEWPPEVEQWRGIVEASFPAELVEDALAIISCESNGDPEAINEASGAAGLFQFTPWTWDWVAGEMELGDYESGAPLDPGLNTAAAAWLTNYSVEAGDSPWHHWNCQP